MRGLETEPANIDHETRRSNAISNNMSIQFNNITSSLWHRYSLACGLHQGSSQWPNVLNKVHAQTLDMLR